MHDMPGDYCWMQEGAWVWAHILPDMHRRVDFKEKGKEFFYAQIVIDMPSVPKRH